MKTNLILSTCNLFIISILIGSLSPYNYSPHYLQHAVITEIEIAKSHETVFDYLRKSVNAKDWSIYVKKITPINGKKVADAKVGSIRKCYGLDTSIVWSAEITEVQKNLSRRLRIFDTAGFSVMIEDLETEQHYAALDNSNTKMSLTLYACNDELG